MNKDFIKEKIIKKTGAGKGFRNFIKIVISAMLFGVVAAGIFAITAPSASKFLGESETQLETEMVTIPRDEPEVSETLALISQSEALAAEESMADGEVINDVTEPVEELVHDALEGYDYSMDDLATMWNNVAKLCNSLDYSIVKVGEEGKFSGIVVAETFGEKMILTKDTAIENPDEVFIEWNNGEKQSGYLRKKDTLTGTAIVAVDSSKMTETMKSYSKPVELGNSYAITRGEMLIAVGSPRGVAHSTEYTWAAYIEKNAQVVDGSARLIYPSEEVDGEYGAWIVNTEGELVGVIGEYDDANVVLGISDYKSILENMINAANSPYVGIVPLDIPSGDESFASAPKGVYVSEVAIDSPAYAAGILPGDIVEEIKDKAVHSVADYKTMMEKLKVNEDASILVYRRARGEYKEIEYLIKVGAR